MCGVAAYIDASCSDLGCTNFGTVTNFEMHSIAARPGSMGCLVRFISIGASAHFGGFGYCGPAGLRSSFVVCSSITYLPTQAN